MGRGVAVVVVVVCVLVYLVKILIGGCVHRMGCAGFYGGGGGVGGCQEVGVGVCVCGTEARTGTKANCQEEEYGSHIGSVTGCVCVSLSVCIFECVCVCVSVFGCPTGLWNKS